MQNKSVLIWSDSLGEGLWFLHHTFKPPLFSLLIIQYGCPNLLLKPLSCRV